jgi:hypothetical protein
MPARRSAGLLLALAAAGSLVLHTGCASARMRVDPALAASAEEWSVTGANPRRWDAPLAVGPYRTGAVRDAGTIGWSVQIQGLGVESAHRPYAFAVSGPGGPVDAECHERAFQAVHASGVQYDMRGARGEPVLACAFRSAARTWTLSLRATGAAQPAYAGELLDDAGLAYAIRSVHAMQGSPVPLGSPAGYELEGNGAKVAVVEILGPGRVLVARGTSDAGALASASAALLLFQPPDDR